MLRRLIPCFRFSTPHTLPKFTEFQLQTFLSQPNPLKDLIKSQLQYSNNEMKLSHYWDLCLTHPDHGFYSQKNVFSTQGHFTTSPQISSIFGEIFGVWIMHFIQSVSKIYPDTKPNKNNNLNLRPFRLIEFGPGRGLFMADILRCIDQLHGLDFLQSVTMIETSAENTKLQQKSVLDELAKRDKHFGFLYNYTDGEIFKGENSEIQLQWFKNLFEMVKSERGFEKIKAVADSKDSENPSEPDKQPLPPFTIIIAHEFFDALPSQSLVYTEKGWRQRVVSLNESDNLVLRPSSHPLHQKFVPLIQNPEVGATVEISPQSLMLMETLSQIISQSNGCILNIDYGNPFSHSDSIRAIKSHKFVPYPHYLDLPGLCDLSAYVDFSSLQQFAEKVEGIKGFGPIPQGLFLESMGINLRIQVLSKGKSEEVKKRMEEDYKRLVSPEEMGEIYKVQMITCKDNEEVYPFLTEDKGNVF